MADKKSCVDQWRTLECMRCGHRETFSEHQMKTTDRLSCEVCKGPTIPSITKPGEPVRNRRTKKNTSNDSALGKGLTVELDIDVSKALKGLKAVQREAKKAAQAVKELEKVNSFTPVLNITVNSNGDPEKIAKAVKDEIARNNKLF